MGNYINKIFQFLLAHKKVSILCTSALLVVVVAITATVFVGPGGLFGLSNTGANGAEQQPNGTGDTFETSGALATGGNAQKTNQADAGVTMELEDADIAEGMELFGSLWDDDALDTADGTTAIATGINSTAKTTANATKNPGSQTKESPTVTPIPTPKPEYPYMIYVSKDSYTIAILGIDDNGEYTKVLRKFSTGIGRSNAQTRAGEYKITGRERWHTWGTNSYSPYAVKHDGGLWFHGPVYTEKDSNFMKPGSYNEIGTSCSSGCLRTTSSASSWIYYNCGNGTPVVIANDSKYTSSRPAQISEEQTWDPTDPGATPEIPITSFVLSSASTTLDVGQTAKLSVSDVKPSDTNTKDYTYNSSNTAVATVNSSGIVTAVGAGSATITVAADDVNGISRKCTVTVNQPPATPVPTPTPTPEATPTPTQSAGPTHSEESPQVSSSATALDDTDLGGTQP